MSAYRTLLVPVDGSPTSERGLREAIRLAKAQKASLVLLHVVDEQVAYLNLESGVVADDLVRVMAREGRRLLRNAQAVAARAGVRARSVLRETVSGAPAAHEILRQARKLHPDLLVLGTHGRRGLRRLVLGSDAEQVVRGAPVPVLLVPDVARPR